MMGQDTGSLWTTNRLSDELGIDRRTLSRRLSAVAPVRMEGRSKLYALRDVFTALLRLEKGDPRELNAERSRLARAQAVRAELELQVRNGELVRADDVRRAASSEARRARELLYMIPDRLAPIMVGMTDEEKCREKLYEEVETVCEAISTGKRPPRRKSVDRKPKAGV